MSADLKQIFELKKSAEKSKKLVIDYMIKQLLLNIRENLVNSIPKNPEIEHISLPIIYNEVINIIDKLLEAGNLNKLPFEEEHIEFFLDKPSYRNLDDVYLVCTIIFLKAIFCLLQDDEETQSNQMYLINARSCSFLNLGNNIVLTKNAPCTIYSKEVQYTFEFVPAITLQGICYEQGIGTSISYIFAIQQFASAGLLLGEANALHRLCDWVQENPKPNLDSLRKIVYENYRIGKTFPQTWLELCELAAGVPTRAKISPQYSRYHRDTPIKPSPRALCDLAVIYFLGLEGQKQDFKKATHYLDQVKPFQDNPMRGTRWGIVLHFNLLLQLDPMHLEYCLGKLAEATTLKTTSIPGTPGYAAGMLAAYQRYKAASLAPNPTSAVLHKESETRKPAMIELMRETIHLPTPLLTIIHWYMEEIPQKQLEQFSDARTYLMQYGLASPISSTITDKLTDIMLSSNHL